MARLPTNSAPTPIAASVNHDLFTSAAFGFTDGLDIDSVVKASVIAACECRYRKEKGKTND